MLNGLLPREQMWKNCQTPTSLTSQEAFSSRPWGLRMTKRMARPTSMHDACPLCWSEIACFVGCVTSQQHASVSQGRIYSDNFTCCHTDIEVADPTFYLTQSQYTDTGPTSPSADPSMPGAWQGSHWSANF